jgi:hypothetical protein
MPAPGNPKLTTLDTAYKLFLAAGVIAALIILTNAVDPRYLIFWTLGLAPVTLLGVGVLVAGIVMGLLCWRHGPLLLLALSPALVIIIGIISDKTRNDTVFNVALIAWSAVTVILPVWWFAKGHRIYQEKLSLANQATPPGAPSAVD